MLLNKINERRLRNLRENINIALYDSRTKATRIIDVLSVLAAVVGIGTLIMFHGFEHTAEQNIVFYRVFRWLLLFYYLKFFVGYLYSFTPKKYFQENRLTMIFLGIILMALIYDAFSPEFLDIILTHIFHIEDSASFSNSLEQISFWLLLMVEAAKASAFLPSMNLPPAKLFVLSFVVLILTGAGLLCLPAMTASGESMRFMDALFTSTTACCVTGLTVVDIASFFSVKGQILIMVLIQLGGLNIISFATFFLILSRKFIGIKNQTLLKESLESNNFRDSVMLLKEIFIITFSIELAGAVLIFFCWNQEIEFPDFLMKLFYSVFHSISAFNNAGLSLFPDGMYNTVCRHSYLLQMVIAVLIFLGGIGFPVIKDLIRNKNKLGGKTLRKLTLHSRIVLYTSMILIVFGTAVFLALEWNNSLSDRSLVGKVLTSLFQSVSARTAGFNSVDFSILMNPTLIMFIFLMFVGASPVSTGGGIKTSTFYLLVLSALRTVKGKQRIYIKRTQVENSAVLRAMTILLFSAVFVVMGIFILSLTDPQKGVMDLAFEQVSAFGTVGLSTGITPHMSDPGKVMLILTMFMGRIGLLTFGFALSSASKTEPDFNYPAAKLIIG